MIEQDLSGNAGLIDAGDETVHRINYEHGNWRIENKIENHARLHRDHAMPKQQRHVTEEVLHVPTNVQPDTNAQRIANEQKRIR